MTIQTTKNLYPGVNAHLNSFLQSEGGGWESFHAHYLVMIAAELDRKLPGNYYAMAEKSLQISEIGLGSEQIRNTRPDISIYQTSPTLPSGGNMSSALSAPTAIMPLAEVLEDEDDYLTSVLIYVVEGGSVPGRPVTRIELLSPANKPPQAYYRQYLARRIQTLRSGLALVEVDLLHESRPVIRKLPSYPDREFDAFPYSVVVSDPHPVPEEGTIKIYGFGVNQAMPTVSIPLAGSEQVELDFGAIYNRLFEQVRVFRMVVDYAQEPPHFERYSAADQEWIKQFSGTIRAK